MRKWAVHGAMFDELKEIIEEMRKGVRWDIFSHRNGNFQQFYLKALNQQSDEQRIYCQKDLGRQKADTCEELIKDRRRVLNRRQKLIRFPKAAE